MRSRTLPCMAAMTLFAALAMPLGLAAQEQQQQQAEKFDRYTVIDLGTLGGTYSQGFGVNNRGWVNGGATLQGDAVVHASLWHDGCQAIQAYRVEQQARGRAGGLANTKRSLQGAGAFGKRALRKPEVCGKPGNERNEREGNEGNEGNGGSETGWRANLEVSCLS